MSDAGQRTADSGCWTSDALAPPKAQEEDVVPLRPSRDDAIEVWVERATGPLRRATRPPLGVRQECTL